MDLKAYKFEGWTPNIRPGQQQRTWMDETNESYAYRCLPLSMANMHGWEVLCPVTFDCRWNGGRALSDLEIIVHHDGPDHGGDSVFGHGVLTFHIFSLIRTDPDWNIWVSGPPNYFKDGVQPLSAIVETDWSPYSFTMNWRFTRPGQWVRFEKDEPICFFFPVKRNLLETVEPKLLNIDDDPDLKRQYLQWSRSRDAFRSEMAASKCPMRQSDTWQKDYYQGKDSDGKKFEDHQTKLRLKPFK